LLSGSVITRERTARASGCQDLPVDVHGSEAAQPPTASCTAPARPASVISSEWQACLPSAITSAAARRRSIRRRRQASPRPLGTLVSTVRLIKRISRATRRNRTGDLLITKRKEGFLGRSTESGGVPFRSGFRAVTARRCLDAIR
jgi:hypothetical protein